MAATSTVGNGGGTGSLWLRNVRWDLTFISLSAALVVLPFAAYEAFNVLLGMDGLRSAIGIDPADVLDVSRNAVNALIALLIGGPHMYATYTRTFLDRDFRSRHVPFLAGSLVIPFGVVYLGVNHFQVLITLFFFWASVHVLHQIAYIIDCYNRRSPTARSLAWRALDYVVVFSSLYPLAAWRMIHGNFKIGQIEILFPPFLRLDRFPVLGWGFFGLTVAVFGGSLVLWLARSWTEHREGRLHGPKALLMGLTIVVAFFIPSYHELDVAFQGFNTWHSFQYLGLTLYINRLREQKEGIRTPLIRPLPRHSATSRALPLDRLGANG